MGFNLNEIILNSFVTAVPNILRMLWPIYLFLLFLIIRKFYFYVKFKKSGMYEIDMMRGDEFEVFLDSFFKRLGYQVNPVGLSKGDYGADLIITKNNQSTAIQAKRHNSSIGVDAIREVLGSLKVYNCSSGIVVTNNFFTKQAKLLAKVNNIELWDRMVLSQKILEVS